MDIALMCLNFHSGVAYLDDTIVYSPVLSRHMSQLVKQFQTLHEANLKLK